ncbi:MAG: CHAT domain-containing protein [Candidatus Electrothrix sp. AX5]|nr:CHAT domain-containing protein [Candidatus Electrothrix sp. AX5]
MKRILGVVLFLLFVVVPYAWGEENAKQHWEELNAQVVTAYQQGKYKEGIAFAEQARVYAVKHFGAEHPDTSISMNNLAGLYHAQGRYSEAEPLYKECLQLREKVLERDHPSTLISINNLAELYESQGRYSEAEPLYKECLQFREKVLGRYHPDTLISINNLAELYTSQGRYSEAEPLYKECLQFREKVLGRYHPDTLTSINNLAELYTSQGRYSEAEPLYKECFQLREKVLGHDHPFTLISINNLAELYESQGRYSEAEPLYKECLQLREKVFGRYHSSTLTSINNLTSLYTSQGRYSEAEPLHKECLQLREKVLGHDHPFTLNAINNLAFLYTSQGRYSEAEPLYKECLQLREKVLGRYHPDTLTSINNLAFLYTSQGRYSEAEPLYKECLQLREKVLGRYHPDTLILTNNLAVLYEFQGRYSEAEPLYKETLQLSEKVFGREHPNSLGMQQNYIGLLVNDQRPIQALCRLKQVENRLLSRSFQEIYFATTDQRRRQYLQSITAVQDMALTLATQEPGKEYQRFAANIILHWKQLYAEESGFQHRLLSLSRDPETIRLRTGINKNRAALSQALHDKKQTPENIRTLLLDLQKDQQALLALARRFKPTLEVSGVNLDQVQPSLPARSGLVEYRLFRPVDFKNNEFGESHVAALVLLADPEAKEQVIFRDLGPLKELASHWTDKKALYSWLLGPFEQQISQLKQLYIAPDNLLGLISFAALRLPDGRFLAERQTVCRLQTGRDLLENRSRGTGTDLIALGGVDYGSMPTKLATSKGLEQVLAASPALRAARQLGQIGYLPESKQEAEAIADLFTTNNKRGKAHVFLGKEAGEHRLKELKQSPRILHLSTHGFYSAEDEESSLADQAPLLLSGLALAGANNGLQGKLDKYGDDGLLYSLEVLGLNLQGTELVSLSACDTGKGVVDYSEGVYGLVRAFRTAGAKNVLMTLTPVGDEVSKDFMTTFYDNWLSSEDNISPAQALHKTRLDFIHHENPAYRDPAIWSPYVMVGK